ncbi:ribosomal-processing cysteine protease Prp [Leptotrichia sp. OH3620_COT-345]|uniref:ribosomal-processing cysteine protease Prp n=1 Tax=Leptotrichia sp. OH3620_COT-345 TaxID=2491048 RepID=UPI000F6527F7|nr:ribosomal-processing cysteine protease Prp [Leptotrichia sp. OH3620_COT-345]RRD39038.1 ribosomal-processing cysteine protease Prp [Leptotrichia sp. OH3620_COT-345]
MIRIEIQKKNERITYFKINGHANFKEYGEDIVCSAVSSVSQMTLNGLLEILKLKNLKYSEKEGYIVCDLEKSGLSDEEYEKADILTQSMFSYLKEIVKTYGKYVKLKIKEV